MPGRFMDKETLEAEAARLHVDLEGLKWPQKQKAVLDAMKEEKLMQQNKLSGADVDGDIPSASAPDFFSDADDAPVPQDPVHVKVEAEFDPMADMAGKRVMICPEMASTPNQLFGYEEELDEDLIVEEVRHEHDSAYRAGKDLVTGTYTIKEKTGKRVVAHTALPKIGAGVEFYPSRDWVPVVTYKGRRGYLYVHHRLPNIKQLLMESGYYEDYKQRFQHEPSVWHAAGKLLCCDINLANSVLREIEKRAADDRAQREQNAEYIRRQLG